MKVRDFLWEYPDKISKIYGTLAPLSYIILFSAISLILIYYVLIPMTNSISKSVTYTKYVEGIVGKVEELNPLYLTNNQAQRDIQSLIFTKLIDISPLGDPIPSLATSWSASGDNLMYTFTLSPDYYFSDGINVTADDVVFTFNKSIELAKQYSESTFGQSVSNLQVEKVSEYEVRFILDEVNATFFETISVEILPMHILQNAVSGSYILTRFGESPIGSGPYMVDSFTPSDIVLKSNKYSKNPPKIQTLEFKFFSSKEDLEFAFRLGEINAFGTNSYSDMQFVSEYKGGFKTYSYELPNRKKIIFFNLRKKELATSAIRRGLTMLIDKNKMISELKIDATPSNTSIPSSSWAYLPDLAYVKYSPKDAAVELKLAGFTKDTKTNFYTSSDGKILSLSLVYLDNEANSKLVNQLKKQLEQEGVILELVPKNYEQITKEVLASRDFELILYEIEVSVDPDQYNLWHSLKANYPDLNISGYKFNRVDIYLERGRQLLSHKSRLENYESFQKALINDSPAIFLYEPKYFFVLPNNIVGFDGTDVKFPQDRFNNIINWNFN